MLNHLLATRYTSSSPPLIVLSDSLLQPGLSLFNQLISSSPSSTHTILLCAEQPPMQAIPDGLDCSKVQVIDCTIDQDFPRPSTSTSSPSSSSVVAEVDLSLSEAQHTLEKALVEAVKKARTEAGGGTAQIAIDGINSFGDELGTEGVWRLIKKGLKALEGLPFGSRLILLHHDHFPLLPSSTSSSHDSPSLLSSLLSPLLSPSTIHLTLHPIPHFETLSSRFSLSLPSTVSPTDSPDLRTTEFLARLRERGVGDPFRRPERSDEEDERIPLDALGDGEAKAVMGWNCRGVTVGKVSRIGGAGNGGGGTMNGAGEKKVVTWGFEGLRRKNEDKFEVEGVELGAVLEPRKLGKSNQDDPISNVNATSSSSSRPAPTSSSSSSSTPTALPFSLSLTPSQLAARSLVANPYEGSNQPIFGEAGYTGQMDKNEQPGAARGNGGLRVEYTADRGDDLDEEEPDEDLEI
ncbi:uncharacterized protein JCM6883_003420 [Sporobolomyces salmoneus]|uniref:uncharacterized protein n=1 Tax=Sporobolomyces salmoneus TaxID=183962 RepID=UPI0031705E4A